MERRTKTAVYWWFDFDPYPDGWIPEPWMHGWLAVWMDSRPLALMDSRALSCAQRVTPKRTSERVDLSELFLRSVYVRYGGHFLRWPQVHARARFPKLLEFPSGVPPFPFSEPPKWQFQGKPAVERASHFPSFWTLVTCWVWTTLVGNNKCDLFLANPLK